MSTPLPPPLTLVHRGLPPLTRFLADHAHRDVKPSRGSRLALRVFHNIGPDVVSLHDHRGNCTRGVRTESFRRERAHAAVDDQDTAKEGAGRRTRRARGGDHGHAWP